MLAALKQSRGRNNPLQRCHKDDNGNGHSGSLAKGTALHNGSKWIFALAPCSIPQTRFCPPDPLWLSVPGVWCHLSPALIPQGSILPLFLIPNLPNLPTPMSLSTTHTHTVIILHTGWNQSAESPLFQGYFHRGSEGQILTPALLLT